MLLSSAHVLDAGWAEAGTVPRKTLNFHFLQRTWDTIGTLGRRHNSEVGATTGAPPVYIVPILDCHHNIYYLHRWRWSVELSTNLPKVFTVPY